ncbi:MAG TPA: glucose-6-phosphate isomerase [Myxococcota bacterium]|nr:glucose-6-phosphate isomerase [Myxococcota bacterium]
MKRSAAAWDIHFEAGGSLAPPLPTAHGVTRAELRAELQRYRGVLEQLQGPHAPSGFVRALGRAALLRAVSAAAARWRRRKPQDLIHIGIGGSSLGAEALLRALAHPRHALLGARERNGPRVHFVDNVDPETLGALLEVVDLRHALVHVVSKSGGTVETSAGFQIVRDALARAAKSRRWAERCVFTTGRGALRELAARERVEVLEFPEDVGGRFSVLTASGLFTPAVAGIDVTAVVQGARRYLARVARAELADNSAAVSAAIAYALAHRHKKGVHVLMPYADALEPFARWYVQLVAESLGKRTRRGARERGVGPTPLAARGTTDQHSQLQLFVDGPPDKWVTFVAVERFRRAQPIAGGDPAPYLAGVELGALLRAEQRGTAVALAAARRPTAQWLLPAIHPQSIGQLFFAHALQTAYQGALYGIDAYDQPGVEAGKVAAFALIGREGYDAKRAEIEARTPPSWRV